MELKYLGTGGAEGVPALFCDCRTCREAARLGGREIRTRSQAVVDGALLIDFPPDSYLHMLLHGVRFFDIKHLIITHSHCDHFYPQDLNRRWGSYAHGITEPLHVYGNEMVGRFFAETCGDGFGVLAFHELEPFETREIAGYAVTPLPARHDETERCYIYLISDGARTILYAHDTGLLPEAAWAYLENNRPRVNLASLDCAYLAVSEAGGPGHMSLADAAAVRERLIHCGCCGEDTRFVISHISHNGVWTHAETEPRAAKEGLITAYDGLVVNV